MLFVLDGLKSVKMDIDAMHVTCDTQSTSLVTSMFPEPLNWAAICPCTHEQIYSHVSSMSTMSPLCVPSRYQYIKYITAPLACDPSPHQFQCSKGLELVVKLIPHR